MLIKNDSKSIIIKSENDKDQINPKLAKITNGTNPIRIADLTRLRYCNQIVSFLR